MTSLPSGTVTFLFTDVERSTQTVEEMGNELYADALDTHRQVLRDAFKAHAGYEVGTEGDSFFVAFARAHDAVDAAIAGQSGLQGHPLRVRMGLHTGEALVRESEYVGHDVHKAKRISDAGHGGQVLLSLATAALVDIGLTDLGPHRLKDLGEPQRIFQIGTDDFPPLRSLESFSHNLPLQRSTFIGRENEIAFVRKLLDEHRIVTLTGVGGCGKTRLALQVGAEVLDAYPDGVFFADLAPISEPGLVPGTIASAVGVPAGEAAAGVVGGVGGELLFDFLRRRHCLILLDNCEHLRDASAELADKILSACPDVTILATSREGLEIEGERAFTVPSMSLPEAIDQAQTSEAVSLFKARAVDVRQDFDLTPRNIEAVVSVCRRLDGIPLAIEFAASRVSHMTPQEIDERLAESFRLLAGGRRRVQRQQTIQATLDWSHDLLTEAERLALRRLAVFAGSFTLEAAEAVVAGDDLESIEVLDLLASLVAKSLVTADEQDFRTRYRLLETVRLYAAEKLKHAGDAELAHGRHRDWYLRWLESMDWNEIYTNDSVASEQDADYPNLIAALEWSAGEDRPDLIARMSGRMYALWSLYCDEGYRWTTYSRPEDSELGVEDRVACLVAAAMCTIWLLDDPTELLERAIAAARDEPSIPLMMAHLFSALSRSVVAGFLRDPAMAEQVRLEIDAAYRIGADLSPFALAMADQMRGSAEITMGAFDRAAEPLRSALSQYDSRPGGSSPAPSLGMTLCTLAALTHVAGEHDEAERLASRSLEFLEAWRTWKSGIIATAGAAFAGAGRTATAKELLADWIDDIRRSGMPGTLEEVLIGFAAIAAIEGHHERASRLLAWIRSRTLDKSRPIRSPAAYQLYVHYTSVVRKALGSDVAQRCRAEGRAMSEDEAVAYAVEGLGDA